MTEHTERTLTPEEQASADAHPVGIPDWPKEAKRYRWASPQEWLAVRIDTAERILNTRGLAAIARELMRAVDGDAIQDAFQNEMDEDGYFDEQ